MSKGVKQYRTVFFKNYRKTHKISYRYNTHAQHTKRGRQTS